MSALHWTESKRRVKAGVQYTFRAALDGKGWVKWIAVNPSPEELADIRRRLNLPNN